MVRSIDPKPETIRGAQRCSITAAMSGARVAETISASGHGRPHPTGRTYGCKRSDQNPPPDRASSGPSTYGHRPSPVMLSPWSRHLVALDRGPIEFQTEAGCGRHGQLTI